jgi:D-alanyl-D-alanine carboxypeptidase
MNKTLGALACLAFLSPGPDALAQTRQTAAPQTLTASNPYQWTSSGWDNQYYPPLGTETDLAQWYRHRMATGNPATPEHAEGTPPRRRTSRTGGGIDDIAYGGKTFDIREFEAQIHAFMDDNVVGFSYAINFQKQLYIADGWGLKRTGDDFGPAWHDGYTRMNIASISKTLTAVAVLQLLEKNGLSINDPVGPWLPDEWEKGYGFDSPQSITFKDLLTHRSGLKQTLTAIEAFDPAFKALDKVKWDGLEAMVAYGTMPWYQDDVDPQYSNVNFALFRVIIPALWEASGESPGIGDLNAEDAAAYYAAYLAENLFIPLGINQAACAEFWIGSPVYFYNFYDQDRPGAEAGDWTLKCGSGGWYLSAYNLANVMANIRYNDAILSPAMRSLMDTHKLGWSYNWSQNGEHGLYLAHAGALYFDDADYPDRREMQGCMMKFPIHVEAVLLVNSSLENNTLPCTKLRQAFDAAWQ